MRIHVIGDSHTDVFKDTGFIIKRHLYTTYNLFNKGLIQNYIKESNEEDKLILCFGEIDCRIHIYNKSIKYNLPFEFYINKTIYRYGRVFSLLKGTDFAVMNIVPSGRWINKRPKFKKYIAAPHEERNLIHYEYHEAFSDYCGKNEIKMIDIWDKIIDNDYHTKREYLFDEVHLNDKVLVFLREEIERVFNIKFRKGSWEINGYIN